MRTGRGAGPHIEPDPVVDLDMRELRRDLLQMRVEPGKAAPALPDVGDLCLRIGKDRAEAPVDLDAVAELPVDLVEANLRHIGPDAEDIGEIVHFR